MTSDEFKAAFHIGDTIAGKWATGKRCLITGMGRNRFLYIDPADRRGEYAKECATTMWLPRGKSWTLVPKEQV